MKKFKKFKEHLKHAGIFYAVWRGIKYIIFQVKLYEYYSYLGRPNQRVLFLKQLKITCANWGVKLYWQDIELTKRVGLNTIIYANGKWHNSCQAKWQIIENTRQSLTIRTDWCSLPIAQIWKIKIKSQNLISWDIDIEVKKALTIIQNRFLIYFSGLYNCWVNSYEEGRFSGITGWEPMVLNDSTSHNIGLRSGGGNQGLPSILFDFSKTSHKITPVIQNSSKEINARCLEARIVTNNRNKNKRLMPGNYRFFSSDIYIFDNDLYFDQKIEQLRRSFLERIENQYLTGNGRNKKIKRVLLVNLPWEKNGRWGVRAGSRWPHIKSPLEKDYLPFPFFLAYAASLLRENNIEACLIDAISEKLSEINLRQKIDDFSGDLLVAETSTCSLEHDLSLLERLKNGIPVMLCGPDTNIRDEKFFAKNKFIDYVLFGEYEYTLLDLIEHLNNGQKLDEVLGLIYRKSDNEIKVNPARPLIDLDTLPWPLREELPMHNYIDNPGSMPLPSVQMIASRGCPFGCKFCLWPQVMYQGRNYRTRDINDVVDEMEYLIKDMGFKSVYFDDDTFNISKERMLNFCHEIKKRNLQGTPWAIMARPDLMDEEILRELASAGLWAVKYGVESADQALLDRVGKNMDVKKTKEMISLTKKLGIKTHLTFTFGLPGETQDTIQKTLKFCLELDPDSAQFSITTPFPGTEYFRELQKNGFIESRNWQEYDGNHSSVISTPYLNARQLEEAKKYAYKAWQEHLLKRNLKISGFKELRNKILKYIRNRGIFSAIFKIFLASIFLTKNFTRDKFLHFVKALRSYGVLGASCRFFAKLSFSYLSERYFTVISIASGSYIYKRAPYCVQIDLTNNCNNNCIGCWCRSPLLANQDRQRESGQQVNLPFDLIKNLIDELSKYGTKSLFFSGGGEPFLHPDIFKIIRYAKWRKMLCHINTSFTLADREIVRQIIDLKLDYLTVSFWAGTAETYAKTHSNKSEKDFYKICDALKLLNNSKINFSPYVKVYNVICNLNCYELNEMIKLCLRTKSEAIEFAVIDTIPGATDKLMIPQDKLCQILEQCEQIKQSYIDSNSCNGFKVINFENFIRRISDIGAINAEYDSEFVETMPCYTGWLFARILSNGDVNSCLKSHRFPIGNIYEQPFMEIWNSARQIEFRRKTLNFDKNDPFFSLIGNDPNCKIGCYKSCDNIGNNIQMDRRLKNLSLLDKLVINILKNTHFSYACRL